MFKHTKAPLCATLTCVLWLATGAQAQSGDTDAASESTVELERLTVFGQQTDTTRATGSAHSISAEALEQTGYDDLTRALQEVPGLYVRGEDGYGLRPNIGIRGASSDRSAKITLMEDGVLFGPAPYAAPAAYYTPLTARMAGIEVFKGPAAIRFGPQSIGGAINLQTAEPVSTPQALIALEGGSDAYRRLQLRGGGWAADRSANLFELIHVATDGFKQLDGGGDTGFEKTEGLVQWATDLGDGALSLRLGLSEEVSDETYLGLTEDDFRNTPDRRYAGSALDRMDWTWGGLRADYQRALWSGSLTLTGYHHDFSRAWRKFNDVREADIRELLANPDTPRNRILLAGVRGEADTDPNFSGDDLLIGTNDRDFRSSGLQAEWQAERSTSWGGLALGHAVTAGMRLHTDRIQRLHDDLAFEVVDGRPVRNAAPRVINADNTGRADALALWLQDEIMIGHAGRWLLVPGLRIEAVRTQFDNRLQGASNRNQTVTVLPGLGINYAATDALTLLAGAHRGFSPAAPGLADNDPEDAINLEAGVRWRPSPGWASDTLLELIAFRSDYRNLTAICTFSSGCDDGQLGQQTNAGRVEVLGFEAVARTGIDLPGAFATDWLLSHTHTQTEFQDAFSSTNPQFGDVEPGFELAYVPENRTHARWRLTHPIAELGLHLTHVSEMRDAAGSGPIPDVSGSDAYSVLDLSARAPVGQQWVLTLRVDNLLDESYVVSRRPFGARPGRPRHVQLGAEWRWGAR